MTGFWWSGDAREGYWLEITGRSDIGTNLNAPQQGEDDSPPHWSYSLLREVQPGDLVFHWQTSQRAIVGCSRAVGRLWEDEVMWAARGVSARKLKTEPHPQPGWYVGLEGYTPLPIPVTSEMLRATADNLWAIRDGLRERHGGAVHFPFYPYRKDELRAQQAYLTKFPRQLLTLFPQLSQAADELNGKLTLPPSVSTSSGLGSAYRPADEDYSAAQRDPFAIDPAIVERGLRGHAATQNALAEYVRSLGLEPRSPTPGDPNFDLAWEHEGNAFVAEVKSVTASNQEKQLRLGLGQILRFRHVLASRTRKPAIGVLALEHRPTDDSWMNLCSALGITLVWKGDFGRLAALHQIEAE